MHMTSDSPFIIGPWLVVPSEHTIQFEQSPKQSIQPKLIELILYLAQQYPRIVSRQELIEEIWQGNNYVGEKALTNSVWLLRQSFKNETSSNEVIETIRKVGYRLSLEPRWQKSSEQQYADKLEQHRQPTPPLTKSLLITLGIIALVLSVLSIGQLLLQQPSFKQHKITNITKSPGSEKFVSPAPDGRRIAFVWHGAKNDTTGHLYLKNIASPEQPPQQLTFDKAEDINYSVWSQDGEYLYFARHKVDENICQIIRLKVDSRQETVAANCFESTSYNYIDLSPDNKILAFHTQMASDQVGGIYFKNLTTGEEDPAFRFSCRTGCGYSDRDFRFSPDGKFIAVTRRFSRIEENIFLLNLTTGQQQQLTFDERDIVGLTWHPDGDKLVFAAQRADRRKGYVLDIDTKEIFDLQLDGFSAPAFARNSGELFYQQRRESYFLSLLSLERQSAPGVTPVIESEFSHRDAHYSQVNGKIVYTSNESGYYELWTANIDGSERQQLTTLQQEIRRPRWSHQGDQIVFLSIAPGKNQRQILIYQLPTQKIIPLNTSLKSVRKPSWSFDDERVVISARTDSRRDLYEISIDSGVSRRLTDDGGRFGVMTTPDTLVYVKKNKGLWRKKIGQQPELLIDKNIFTTRYSWALAGNKVYFERSDNNHQVLSEFDLESGNFSPLLALPQRSIRTKDSFSYIASQNALLFSQIHSPQSDIKQLEHPLLND